MTDAEKITMVKTMTDETSDAVIAAYLSMASEAILNQMYQMWSALPENAVVPDRYEMTQCNLCVRYLARRGAEGEHTHNENGVNRTWETSEDKDILCRITPIAEVPQ